MNIPADLKYTTEHEWVNVEGNIATIGITDWAQSELGDIVFVELPNEGEEFGKGSSFGTIEAVKAVSDLYAPLSGKVVEVNTHLDDNPMVINSDPYGEGWMIRFELNHPEELDDLLDSNSYNKIIEA